MSKFYEEEFKQRLRRVCGVTDDTTEVKYELDYDEAGYYGCETCGDYTDGGGKIVVTVSTFVPQHPGQPRRITTAVEEFKDLGALIRAMEGVEL